MRNLLLLAALLAPSYVMAAPIGIRVTAGVATVSAGSIDSTKLTKNAVDSEKIYKNAVDSEKIVAASVGNDKLTANAVDTGKLNSDSVDTGKILNTALGFQSLCLGNGTRCLSGSQNLVVSGGATIVASTLSVTGASGRIGIGAAQTYSKLSLGSTELNGATNRFALHETTDGTTLYGMGVILSPTSGSYGTAFWNGLGATTANPQMFIDQNGRVGIGTVAPSSKLHVSSSTILVDGTGAAIRSNGRIEAASGTFAVNGTGAASYIQGNTYLDGYVGVNILNAQNLGLFHAAGQSYLPGVYAAKGTGHAIKTNGNVEIATGTLIIDGTAVPSIIAVSGVGVGFTVEPTSLFDVAPSTGNSSPSSILRATSDNSTGYRQGVHVGCSTAAGAVGDCISMWSDGTAHQSYIQSARIGVAYTPLGLDPQAAGVSIGRGSLKAATLLHMSSGTLTVDGTSNGVNISSMSINANRSLQLGKSLFVTGGNVDPGGTDPTAGLAMAFESGVGTIRAVQSGVASFNMVLQPTAGFVGIGSGLGAPASKLHMSSGTLTIDGNSTNALMLTGHIVSTGTAPSIATCGTNPVIDGTDTAGYFNPGTTPGTGCAITFAVAYPTKAPACFCNDATTNIATRVSAVSTTGFTCAGVFVAADAVQYLCIGGR